MDWSLVIAGLALVGSIVTAIVALRKAPHDEEHIDAQSDHIRVQARKLQDERLLNLEKKLDLMQVRLDIQDDQLRVQAKQIRELKRDNILLREWASSLSDQVVFLGGTPVEIGE